MLIVYASSHLRGRTGGLVALLIAMCILLAFQAAAIVSARRKTKVRST